MYDDPYQRESHPYSVERIERPPIRLNPSSIFPSPLYSTHTPTLSPVLFPSVKKIRDENHRNNTKKKRTPTSPGHVNIKELPKINDAKSDRYLRRRRHKICGHFSWYEIGCSSLVVCLVISAAIAIPIGVIFGRMNSGSTSTSTTSTITATPSSFLCTTNATNSFLTNSQFIVSSSQQYTAGMLNGQFGVYNSSGSSLWIGNTPSSGAYLAAQTDGNLVVYSSGATAIWASNTLPGSGGSPYCLTLYNNGTLLWTDRSSSVIWHN